MKSFRAGSAFGIPIELDLTFLLILPVFAYLIGLQLGELVPLLNGTFGFGLDASALTATASTRYAIGAVAALGLFVCVVAHEFGHSLVARQYGVPIESITLWLLGGVARMEEIPEDWRKEFAIAIAGPVVSVGVGLLAYVGFLLTPTGGSVLGAARFTLAYLAVMNVVLAAFNLLPGFPMDGGRILRALLARSRPHAKATQQAAIALAFFIYIAAASESTRTAMRAAFEGVTVRDVMTPREELDIIDPTVSVADLVDRMFRERHTGYPVLDGDRVVGVVTLSDAREIDEIERDARRVEDVMSRELHTVTPETPVMDAFETMQENGVGRLLVMADDGRLVGLLSRTDVMTALEIVKSGGDPSRRPVAGGETAGAEVLERDRA
ncbi:metalloprotease [Halobacteriales archaeon SW_5_68_122]|nr:MAG: metalloprotease [Halobacteriales archaeon SW_5_68_122]